MQFCALLPQAAYYYPWLIFAVCVLSFSFYNAAHQSLLPALSRQPHCFFVVGFLFCCCLFFVQPAIKVKNHFFFLCQKLQPSINYQLTYTNTDVPLPDIYSYNNIYRNGCQMVTLHQDYHLRMISKLCLLKRFFFSLRNLASHSLSGHNWRILQVHVQNKRKQFHFTQLSKKFS